VVGHSVNAELAFERSGPERVLVEHRPARILITCCGAARKGCSRGDDWPVRHTLTALRNMSIAVTARLAKAAGSWAARTGARSVRRRRCRFCGWRRSRESPFSIRRMSTAADASETLIGRWLQSDRPNVFVATKLGRAGDPGWPGNFTPNAMRAHTEASLRRLGVDALDLTQLHCVPTEVLRQGDVFETLRQLQQEGKIRYFGASVESMEEALICLEQEDCFAADHL